MDAPRRTATPKPFFNRWRLGFLTVLAASVLAYLPALGGEKVWDDTMLIDGTGIGGGQSLSKAVTEPFLNAYFRPLVSITFFLENRLYHGNPFFYHQSNILLHALTAAALTGLLLLAFGSRRAALLGGLLFAVQPAQVSTVAWIGGRTDSLCSLLVVLFAYALLLGIRASGWAKRGWIAASAVCFFLALATKEQIVALLPLVPLALKAFSPEASRKDHLKLLAPYGVVSVVFAAMWLALYPNPFQPLIRSPLDQLLTAGHTSTYYALLLILPSAKWMHTLSLGSLEAAGLLSAIAGWAVAAGFVWLCFRRVKREPRTGWFFVFLLLALLPVSNLVPLPSLLVAPYRAGVAGVGVAALLGVWLARRTSAAPRVWAPVAAAYVAWCAALTWWGSTQWAGPTTIFSAIAHHDPSSIIARRNLSSSLLRQGKAEAAEAQIEGILTSLYGDERWRDPSAAEHGFRTDQDLRWRIRGNQGNKVDPEDWLGELFAQLGYARAGSQDFEGSREAFRTGVRIDPRNPNIRSALAQFAFHDRDYAWAERHMLVAIYARPEEASFHSMRAQALAELGRLRHAEQEYQRAIKLQPWLGPNYLALADLQARSGRAAEARLTLERSKNCKVIDKKGLEERLAKLDTAQQKNLGS